MKDKKSGIEKTFLLFVSIFMSLVLACGGYLYYIYEKGIIYREKKEDLNAISELKMKQLTGWLNEREENADALSISPVIIKAISGDGKSIKELKIHFDKLRRIFNYENIFIALLNGRIIISADQNEDVFIPAISEKIVESMATGMVYFTDLYYCNIHKEIHFDILTPLKINDGKIVVLVLRVNPYDYLYPLIQSWPVSSNSAETLIVRKEEDHVLFLNESNLIKNMALNYTIALTKVESPSVQAALGNTGFFEGIDCRGMKVFSYLTPIPNTQWHMVVKIDKKEVFRELYYRVIVIIVLISILIFIIILCSAFFYHYRQKKMYMNLFYYEKHLNETESEFRASLYSIGEAVITADKNFKVKRLNRIAEDLTGWTESNAQSKAIDEIFKIVDDKTHNIISNASSKVLKTGEITIFPDHILLISKEGEEIPITASIAPITNGDNEMAGIVIVFLDQTEGRLAKKNLEDSERKFRETIKYLEEGYFCSSKEGILVEHNNAFNRILGFDESEDLKGTVLIDFWQNPEDRNKYVDELNKNNYLRNYLINAKKLDGTKIIIMANIHLVKDDKKSDAYISGTISDITELKEAEKSIGIKDELLRISGELAKVGGWEFDTDTLKGTWTDAVAKIHDLDPSAETNVSLGLSFYKGESLDRIKKAIDNAISKYEPYDLELEMTSANGVEKSVRTIGIPVIENGKAVKLRGVFQDITERKKNEEKIKSSLLEKEILLKELFHRTKNNMNLIMSFLILQKKHIIDDRILGMFDDLITRIQAISLVQQKLYQSRDLSKIHLNDYFVDLINHLKTFYKIDDSKINFDLDLEDIVVLFDIAAPCGMILNEIITNSIRHAFDGSRDGKICITMKDLDDENINITISDNGSGLPEELDLGKSQSLGLITIFNIVENQLNGRIKYKNENGLKYDIFIKKNIYLQRI